MEQSRKWSMIESLANLVVGYAISIVILHLLHMFYGVNLGMRKEASIVAVFTVASVLRSYTLRRLFIRRER